MNSRRSIAVAAILFAAVGVSATSHAEPAPTKEQIRKVFSELAGYDYGKPPGVLSDVDDCIGNAGGNKELRGAIESELVGIIASDAKFAAKQAACRSLMIVGSDASVGPLSKMLASKDARIVQAACYALSGMCSPKARDALRKALDPSATPARQIAIINILGNMADSQSLAPLVRAAGSKETAVSQAAISAIGRIASSDAVAFLRRSLSMSGNDRAERHSAAAALLQAAQEMARRGKTADAAEIYRELASAKVPDHIRRGAFLGRAHLNPTGVLAEVLAALDGDDPTMKAAAISLIPSIKGENVASRAAGKMGKLSPAGRRSLVRAIGKRRDAAGLTVLIKAAGDPDTAVQVAAMEFLGRSGDKKALGVLLEKLADRNSELQAAAGRALRIISAKGADAAILEEMKSAKGPTRTKLIRIMVDRRYKPATPECLMLARGADPDVARQAVRAVRILAGTQELPAVIALLEVPACDGLRDDLIRAIAQIAHRSDRGEDGARIVLAELDKSAGVKTRSALLGVMGKLGDKRGYDRVLKACRDADAMVRNAGLHALVAWPYASAAGDIAKLAGTASSEKWRILALRGYIRVIGLDPARPKARTLDMYEKAIKLARRRAEKKLILAGLVSAPDRRSLAIAEALAGDPKLAKEANLASKTIRRALGMKQ